MIHPSKWLSLVILFSFCLINLSCDSNIMTSHDANEASSANILKEEKAFVDVMEKHLNAVTNKDLVALKETMSPVGKMQLIVPNTEIMQSVDRFLEYHKEWFQDTTWTFETKVLNTEIGPKLGMAITEIVYREPDRNGKPYFNRMIVSYVLEKIENQWYIIKDHASSIEKSTDKK